MSNEQHTNTEVEKQIEVTAEVTCILNGILIGAAAVLIINTTDEKDEELEEATIKYLRSYVTSLIQIIMCK